MNYDQQCNQYKKKPKKNPEQLALTSNQRNTKKKDHDCMTLEIKVIAFDKKCFFWGGGGDLTDSFDPNSHLYSWNSNDSTLLCVLVVFCV